MPVRAKQPETLWLGCFEVEEPGAEPLLGSFQMIVQAKTAAVALERCKKRLRSLRATTTLFGRPCAIDLLHIIKLDGGFTDPTLVNYVSTVDAKHQASIYCAVPEQPDRMLESYGLRSDESGNAERFLDFGAAAFHAALAEAVSRNDGIHARPPSGRVPRSRRARG